MSTKQTQQTDSSSKDTDFLPAINLGTGISFGFILGLLLGNIGMGLSFGLSFGGLVNAIREKRRGEKGSQPAIVIWVLALILVIGLWIWTG